MGEQNVEENKEEAKAKLKQLLDTAKSEDEMIFDHGPLIIGSRDHPPKDRFMEQHEELASQVDR